MFDLAMLWVLGATLAGILALVMIATVFFASCWAYKAATRKLISRK